MRSFFTARQRLVRILLLLPLLMAVLVGCGGTKVASDRNTAPQVAPGASNKLPQTEEATLKIAGGAFGSSTLQLQQDEPTTLHIVNGDTTAYQLKIEGLAISTAIPASATTDVAFTTPKAGTYTGQLLAADNAVLSEIQVTIQAPGGV